MVSMYSDLGMLLLTHLGHLMQLLRQGKKYFTLRQLQYSLEQASH